MNSMERIKAMVEGKPVDRIGISAWYHMPLLDHVAKDFADGIINSVETMKWDVCKVQYHGYYFVSSFGQDYVPSVSATQLYGPVKKWMVPHPKMFEDLKMPSLTEGPLARELELTKRIMDKLGGKVPVLPTIFSPMHAAEWMTGGSDHTEYIYSFMKYNPKEVHKGLEIITEANLRFLEELLKLGVDGIFLADVFSSKDQLSEEMHDEFVKKYDLQILDACKDHTWFNILHAHGWKNLRFDEYEKAGYPIQAYNWEDCYRDSTLKDESQITTLADARKITDKILMGGIEFWNDFNSAENDRWAVKEVIKKRLLNALEMLGPDDQKFIFTPGCSVKMHVPEYRMKLIHEVVEEITGIA
ncbi:MAG: uroporphyrinogen decarboxylase family protein [Eubacteriales bacterium]|nr:uroporphyrinogen decarboxylase family protein [Eubacteriales bacterium]